MRTTGQIIKGRLKNNIEKNHQFEERVILIRSAKNASSLAIRSSKALGLSIKIIKDGSIVSISANKTETIGKKITKSSIDISNFKKGMSLSRK